MKREGGRERVGLGEINQGRSWVGLIACAALVAATCLSSARGLCHPLSDQRLSPVVLFPLLSSHAVLHPQRRQRKRSAVTICSIHRS